MPGILPMKVIKVGTSAQSRIAQACDRCRSKKIRCDGITPCCSQCANVGFECKTSDKLSRRAFPRGYTESLEERVRNLEGEVKELKDLVDAKDEKIDMLSRIYSNTPSLGRLSSTTSSSSTDATSRTNSIDMHILDEDTITLHQSTTSNGDAGRGPYFTGPSSGRAFLGVYTNHFSNHEQYLIAADAFKAKLKEMGKPFPDFNTQAFFEVEMQDVPPLQTPNSSPNAKMPSRMASDQMINIYFQEWASLFPILHRPTILKLYSDFVASPDDIKDQHAIAQLYLIFGIAASSAEWNKHDAWTWEPQWQAALEAISTVNTVPTLQCLLLAQIYCIAKGDYKRLLTFRAAAVKLSRRLGLHQRQKRSSVGPLITETRKRVFWTLYTIDCFSAALLGQPRSLSEEDIKCEYPQDVDDENVTDEGFQPTLPGESTRLSSALALFRGTRILSRVLDGMYSTGASHHLSMQTMATLNEELDTWLASLPPHLRLQFVQDKPSTDVVGSRSPFLSLAYHYIRTLIHRPVAGSSAGSRASTSIVALAQSSKHIVQIVQLLEERRMSFSFCLNQSNILTLAGFGLLFQTLDLDRKGKLIEDSQRLLCSVISILERYGAPGAAGFKKVACAMITVDRCTKTAPPMREDTSLWRKSDLTIPTSKSTSKSPRQLQASISRSSSSMSPAVKEELNGRHYNTPTLPTPMLPAYSRKGSQSSIQSITSDPVHDNGRTEQTNINSSWGTSEPLHLPNLDYLDFSSEPTPKSNEASPILTKSANTNAKPATNGSHLNEQGTLDTIFPSPDVFSYSPESPSNTFDWCSDIWTIPTNTSDQPQTSQRTLSFSEEELTSGEELSSCGTSGELNARSLPEEKGLVALDGLDAGFR
ncbi:MAG: hypothetical protein Q9217_000098 [Psora testacea]